MTQDNALDHLEEEINELESVNPWGRAVRWGGGIIIVVAVIAWIVWLVASPPSSTSARMSYVPAAAAGIELSEPRGLTLDEPPARFAWESVTGRFQYIVRVYVKGSSEPLLDRATTASSYEPLPDERAKIQKGKTYVWTVVAQGKDGATIGAGQATFKVR